MGTALDDGPFFHGTKADLKVGDLLTARNRSNYRPATRSYRSTEPLRVVGEVDDWPRLSPEGLQDWRDRIAAIEDEGGEIIN